MFNFVTIANLDPIVFSSAVPPAQRSFSNADSSVVVVVGGGGGGVNFKGGKGQSQKRFSNFFSFLAWGFFGMTLTTYHNKDLVESLLG